MLAPHSNPPRKRDVHPVLLLSIIVLAVLAVPALIYGLFVAAFFLLPGGID